MSRNQSLAYGFDYAVVADAAGRLPVRLLQVQRQRAAVRLRHHAGRRRGHSRAEPRQTFTSGLPAGFIDGDGDQPAFNFGSGLGVNRCNCPLDQDEKQLQLVGNVTKTDGNHTFKFGVDVRRAHNLRVPSDAHRSGELTFYAATARRGPAAAASGSRPSCSAT